jgi:hypothetical protein
MQRASVTAVACVDFGPQEFRTRLEEHGPQIERGSFHDVADRGRRGHGTG